MKTRCLTTLAAAVGGLLGLAIGGQLAAQQYAPNPYYQPNLYNNPNQAYQLNNFYYYPFYYFPHNYWPATGPRWPEAPGEPYMRPPAYMAYPPYLEPTWHYDLWQPGKYYRGFHFWLDQF
jgi:hypothetical protein